MLCTEVTSALALGETRIRVYGLQPRWKKYMKQLSGRRTERKFDEVVQQLAQLTQQAWALQEGPNANSNSRCFHPSWLQLHVALLPVQLLPGCRKDL